MLQITTSVVKWVSFTELALAEIIGGEETCKASAIDAFKRDLESFGMTEAHVDLSKATFVRPVSQPMAGAVYFKLEVPCTQELRDIVTERASWARRVR